jgi:hypothetical protein
MIITIKNIIKENILGCGFPDQSGQSRPEIRNKYQF